jgi:hypothetical protein
MRPALTGTGWKKPSRPVQGWGAVQLEQLIRWTSSGEWGNFIVPVPEVKEV